MLMDLSPTKSLSKSVTFLFLLLSLFLLLTGNGLAQKGSASVRGLARGQAAINKLSDRLPAVALRYGKSPSDLRQLFLKDSTLYIDETDKLLYIDDAPEQTEKFDEDAPASSQAAPFPYNETFSLHSRPGSNRVIYLDFDGYVTTGTAWNSSFTNGQPINSAPFSIDGDPNSFNQQEQDVIQYIWQRIAEDYAPFDVDVTTQDPGDNAIIRSSSSDLQYGSRAVISPTNWYGSGIGGVGFVGSFNYFGTTYKPVFVFSADLGNSEKNIAEATSHEVGHNLGLNHDGTSSTGYYTGHGDWAPIMGAGYYKSVTQWSKGEYPNANNQEDDLAIMQSYGISLIPDDHGNTNASATVLSGSNINASGLITTRSDVDVFQFSTDGGNVTINVNPAPRGGNLNIQAKISDAQGNVIATSDPAGLSASFSQTLSAGVYYLTIDGVGAGDLSTGYSDYASIGQYSITGTLTASNGQPPIAAVSANPTSGTTPLTVSFSSINSSDPDGTIVSYAWNFGDGTSSTAPNPVHVYNSAGSFTAVLTVTDNSGLTDTESVVITATAQTSNQSPVAVAGADKTSGLAPLTVNFSSQGSYDPDGTLVSYAWSFGDGTPSSNQANPSHTYNNVGNYTAILTVTDNNGATNSKSVGISVQAQQPPPTADYTLVASPSSVAPGGQLTISWTAPSGSSSLDWIGLFKVGTANTESEILWWRYTNGAMSGSYTLSAPTQPGQYEFRYLLNNGFTSVKTSNVVSVASSANQLPVAVAGADKTSGLAPLTVNFSSQGSYDPDGTIVSYAWSFGDGTPSSNQANPSHVYNNAGNYTAILTVTDNNGATNSKSVGISVQAQQPPPTADYTLVASPSSVAPGGQLTISWTAPSNSSPRDWIGLFKVGTANTEYIWWEYTYGVPSSSYTLSAPTQPGQYEFRYLLNGRYTSVKASNIITVQ